MLLFTYSSSPDKMQIIFFKSQVLHTLPLQSLLAKTNIGQKVNCQIK